LEVQPNLLRRAIRNLLDNALKYAGAAEIEVSGGKQAVTIAVRDRGPGLPPQELERVSGAFYRGEPSRNRETGGAGLGLSIAQAVADAHGGKLTFANRAGGGLIASIELPIRDVDAALKELNRVAGKPGLRAVHLPDSIENRDYLFEPPFAPLLARIEELGYPILFHNLNSDLFGRRPADAGLDNAFAHAVLASKFISTGTLDKFPKLDIVLPHAGGAFPYLAGRVEHFMDHMGANANRAKPQQPFKTYLRRFHYDYLTYHPEGFRFLLSLVGSDRIVVGTDSFNARDIEYPSAVVEQFKLPAVDRDRILKGNAMRLLRL
jgi:predicted TIM-barrel fold metal-dependent hydrolase